MKILLLQDEIYLPSLGGATKANRFLLESLTRQGHECLAVTRALTRSPDGPRNEAEFLVEMKSRGIAVTADLPRVYSYTFRGVQVQSLDLAADEQRHDYLMRAIERHQPDWVLVADDKRRFMIDAAVRIDPERTILLLQTVIQLPFGPLALRDCPQQTAQMKQTRAIVAISHFLKDYLQRHGGLSSSVRRLPFFGQGPFPLLARHDRGFVTMVNPCPLKGVSVFLALAQEYSDLSFAAVPTWGADDEIVRQLQQFPNVHLLDPVDDIEEILAHTRILLVPSLWPETFGYVVPEAMLRGIPVLASNLGGLPEAKLGVDYLLPVAPAERMGGRFVCPPQDTAPWSNALRELVADPQAYQRCSEQSRAAALDFVAQGPFESVEGLLAELSRPAADHSRAVTDRGRPPLHPEFQGCIDRQPYSVTLDGLRLIVDEDVFPPDLGQCAQNLARLAARYRPHVALDMGCGTGYLALMLERQGVPEIWASDVHRPAIACTRKNVQANAPAASITVVQSDLFDKFPASVRFDLIVFNQPFGPGRGDTVCGCGPDGGSTITQRFLRAAAARVKLNGVVLMAFSDRVPAEHSPAEIATQLGYPVVTLLQEHYGDANNFIYEIRPR